MLYVFLVNNGQMMTFDMNIAVQSVEELQSAIQKVYKIPVAKQVLLISGGTVLDAKERVCNYSAGADTNPIFLYNKLAIETHSPLNFNIDGELTSDFEVRVLDAAQLEPSIQTVQTYVQLGKNFHEKAEEELTGCESLVKEQHLQQQGWAAAFANFEDVVVDLERIVKLFQEKFTKYLTKRKECIQYICSFESDVEVLSKIPILPLLCIPKSWPHSKDLRDSMIRSVIQAPGNDGDLPKPLTLLEYIHPKGREYLQLSWEACSKSLEMISSKEMDDLNNNYAAFKSLTANADMKEIKGIEQRLTALEQYKAEACGLVSVQKDIALGLSRNQNRARNLKDDSILPDLCHNHITHLKSMLVNHQQLLRIYRSCLKAKEDFSNNLHKRLRWLMCMQQHASDLETQFLAYDSRLTQMKKRMDIIRQIHYTPYFYLKAIHEVVRRKIFSDAYLKWAKNFSGSVRDIHDLEISRRRSFNMEFNGHLLQCLFPGLEDMPPVYAKNYPGDFDNKLPQLTLDDVRKLLEVCPEVKQYHDFSELFEFHLTLRFLFHNPQCSSASIQTMSTFMDENNQVTDGDHVRSMVDMNVLEKKSLDKSTSCSRDNLTQCDLIYAMENTDMQAMVEQKDAQIARLEMELQKSKQSFDDFVEDTKKFAEDSLLGLKEELRKLRSTVFDNLSIFREKKRETLEEVNRVLITLSCTASKVAVDMEAKVVEWANRNEALTSTQEETVRSLMECRETIRQLEERIASQQAMLDDRTMVQQLTLEHELELESVKSQLKEQLNERDVQISELEAKMAQLSESMAYIAKEKETIEATVSQQIQEEKDNVVAILETSYRERERSLKDSLEKQHVEDLRSALASQRDQLECEMSAIAEANARESLNRLRKEMEEKEAKSVELVRLEAEEKKLVALKELREQMLQDHRQEVDTLRARFKLMTNLDNLEKHQDFIDLATHNRIISEMKMEMEMRCKETIEAALVDPKISMSDSVRDDCKRGTKLKHPRDSKAAVFTSEESDMKRLMTTSCIEPIQNQQRSDCEDCIMTTTVCGESDIHDLKAEPLADIVTPILQKTKNGFFKCLEFHPELARLYESGLVRVSSCDIGDVVVAIRDPETNIYFIYQSIKSLHLIHHNILQNFGISSSDPTSNPQFILLKVTKKKEYCRVTKTKNRLNFPLDTRFYRITGIPPEGMTCVSGANTTGLDAVKEEGSLKASSVLEE